MQKGEVADLECKPEFAYGESGSPPKIPPNSTLVFNVELVSWEGEDISNERDGSITKSIIAEGEEHNCPEEDAPVKVHVVGQALGQQAGRTFLDKHLEFILGEGSEHQLPSGVDKALRRVNKGEKCRVLLRGSRYNYGTHPPAEFNLEPNAELIFILFLKDFDKVKASWEMTDAEKLEVAQKAKERGTMFLKEGKMALALHKYASITTLLEHCRPNEDSFKEPFEAILIAGYLNSSLVNLKTNETSECIKNCERALEKDPKNVKALYRKAQALEQRKDYEEAIEVFKEVIAVDPGNKASLQQINVCKGRLAEVRSKERKKFAGMFDKLSKQSV